jgi:hypothetical protein
MAKLEPCFTPMTQFLDESLLAQVREVREQLIAGAARAAEAVTQVETLLRGLGLGIRIWLPLGVRTIRSPRGTRRVEVFLGYSDEGDGAWGVKLRTGDPQKPGPARFIRLADCSPDIRMRLLPQLRRLVTGVVGRARELADVIERALGE